MKDEYSEDDLNGLIKEIVANSIESRNPKFVEQILNRYFLFNMEHGKAEQIASDISSRMQVTDDEIALKLLGMRV